MDCSRPMVLDNRNAFWMAASQLLLSEINGMPLWREQYFYGQGLGVNTSLSGSI